MSKFVTQANDPKRMFEFSEIVRLKVKNRWRDCLTYSILDDGIIYANGLITLDKKWMRPARNTASYFPTFQPIYESFTKVRFSKSYFSTTCSGYYVVNIERRINSFIDDRILCAVDNALAEKFLLERESNV